MILAHVCIPIQRPCPKSINVSVNSHQDPNQNHGTSYPGEERKSRMRTVILMKQSQNVSQLDGGKFMVSPHPEFIYDNQCIHEDKMGQAQSSWEEKWNLINLQWSRW